MYILINSFHIWAEIIFDQFDYIKSKRKCISYASVYERNGFMYIEMCLKYIKFTPEKFIEYLVTKVALNSRYHSAARDPQ